MLLGVIIETLVLKSLLHPCRDRPEAVVHLAGWLSENQTDDGLARDAGVFEAAKDVDLGVGEYDACARGILDGVLGLAVLACDAADGAGEMVALQGLDVLDLEGCT